MVVLGLLETSLVVIGASQAVVDEKLMLDVPCFPGILKPFLIYFDCLRVVFQFHADISHSHESLGLHVENISVGGEHFLYSKVCTAWW